MDKHKIYLILKRFEEDKFYNERDATKAIFSEFKVCITCGDANKTIIKAGVPWGLDECKECREKTGNCLICRDNRNDCCC